MRFRRLRRGNGEAKKVARLSRGNGGLKLKRGSNLEKVENMAV